MRTWLKMLQHLLFDVCVSDEMCLNIIRNEILKVFGFFSVICFQKLRLIHLCRLEENKKYALKSSFFKKYRDFSKDYELFIRFRVLSRYSCTARCLSPSNCVDNNRFNSSYFSFFITIANFGEPPPFRKLCVLKMKNKVGKGNNFFNNLNNNNNLFVVFF